MNPLIAKIETEDYAGEQLSPRDCVKSFEPRICKSCGFENHHHCRDCASCHTDLPRFYEELECLKGNAQLVSIAQYDAELALELKALENQLEEADFESANQTAMRCQKLVWKNLCVAHGRKA